MPPTSSHTASPDRKQGRAWRLLLAVAAGLIAIVLLVSGCGGSTTSRATVRPSVASFGKQFVAFAVCMRSHGLTDYPEPQISSSGGPVHITISPGSLSPNPPAFNSAQAACHELLANGGAPGRRDRRRRIAAEVTTKTSAASS
jgi:hypothetical protein